MINITYISFIATLLATIASFLSIFIPNKFEYSFKESDWTINELIITGKKHGMGNFPQVSISERKSENNFEPVFCDECFDQNNGNVIIRSNSIFEGKVII